MSKPNASDGASSPADDPRAGFTDDDLFRAVPGRGPDAAPGEGAGGSATGGDARDEDAPEDDATGGDAVGGDDVSPAGGDEVSPAGADDVSPAGAAASGAAPDGRELDHPPPLFFHLYLLQKNQGS